MYREELLAASRRAGLGPLGAVLRAPLAPLLHAFAIERAAHDMIAHARQIANTPTANQHHRVLLQVVALARNVGIDLIPVGEPDAGHLAERRIRLLGRHGADLRAYTALLRSATQPLRAVLERVERELQRGRLGLLGLLRPAFAHELVDRRQLLFLIGPQADNACPARRHERSRAPQIALVSILTHNVE